MRPSWSQAMLRPLRTSSGGRGGAEGTLPVTNGTTGPGLTAAVPDDQVPALLQVYGQQVGKRAGEVTHAIASFPESLHGRRSKLSRLSRAPGREFPKHFYICGIRTAHLNASSPPHSDDLASLLG